MYDLQEKSWHAVRGVHIAHVLCINAESKNVVTNPILFYTFKLTNNRLESYLMKIITYKKKFPKMSYLQYFQVFYGFYDHRARGFSPIGGGRP